MSTIFQLEANLRKRRDHLVPIIIFLAVVWRTDRGMRVEAGGPGKGLGKTR